MPKDRLRKSNTLKRLAARTANALAAALSDAGLSDAEITIALREASQLTQKDRRNELSASAPDSAQLGTALALWHRDSRFTDKATGTPLPLAVAGRGKSLTALLRAAGVRSTPERWARFLVTSGALKTAGDAYLPRGRSARMPSLNELHVDHVALGLYHLIRTATRNYTVSASNRPMLQGAAVVRNFPVNQREDFRKFVNAQGDAFLSSVDDYLELRAKKKRMVTFNEKRSTRAGVYVVAFVE